MLKSGRCSCLFGTCSGAAFVSEEMAEIILFHYLNSCKGSCEAQSVTNVPKKKNDAIKKVTLFKGGHCLVIES